MPISIPTVSSLRDQIISDIESKLGTTVPILPKAALRVIATALAGALALLYRMARWAYAQIFPQTADAEALERIGARYGITRTPAVRAKVQATVTGTNGTLIPAGTLWTAQGLVYAQESAVTIAGGTGTVIVECLTAGLAGNLTIGATVTVASPIAGLTSTATVASPSVYGADAETTDALRTRVLDRMQNVPQGGAAPDYVNWAREVTGIVKAFAFLGSPGYVNVYPLIAITGASRIPPSPIRTTVSDYLNAPSRRPLCATVNVLAMTERTVDVTIAGVSPSDATTKANITSALSDYFYAAYPKQYTDEPNATNILTVAAIWSAILAAGAVATSLSMTVSGIGTTTTYTLPNGEICKLGTVTWT